MAKETSSQFQQRDRVLRSLDNRVYNLEANPCNCLVLVASAAAKFDYCWIDSWTIGAHFSIGDHSGGFEVIHFPDKNLALAIRKDDEGFCAIMGLGELCVQCVLDY